MLTAPRRVLTLLVTTLLLVTTFGDAAMAEPSPGVNEDGGQNLTVRQALDKATAEYNDAKGRLDKGGQAAARAERHPAAA
jgi:peptidoglycan DL-endopeptidase CwlO